MIDFSRSVCPSVCQVKRYTMGCPPVGGDNPRALARGLSPRTGGQTWYNYFIPTSISVDLAHRAKVGMGGISFHVHSLA